MIYFDNNATTAPDPRVVETMLPFLTEQYGNPSSAYRLGAHAHRAVEQAREQVAALVGCEPREILFTSCGTEGNNAAIASALAADPDKRHVVTTAVEHSAVKKYCERLARQGYEITWLPVDGQGRLDPAAVAAAIREDTAVVSIIWANNESGNLSPIAEIAEIARAHGTFFHTDAVQAAGKIPVNLRELPDVQFLTLAGHKFYAPKGVGALYVNRRARFTPYLVGGGQENGRRGGTENVASIVAFGKAAELAASAMPEEQARLGALRDRFERGLMEGLAGVEVNGDPSPGARLPNTANLYFSGVESEALLVLFDKHGLCASAGSACTTNSVNPSHVLTAMGHSVERARGSLRFSLGRFNTEAEIDRGIEIVTSAVSKVRALMTPAAVA